MTTPQAPEKKASLTAMVLGITVSSALCGFCFTAGAHCFNWLIG